MCKLELKGLRYGGFGLRCSRGGAHWHALSKRTPAAFESLRSEGLRPIFQTQTAQRAGSAKTNRWLLRTTVPAICALALLVTACGSSNKSSSATTAAPGTAAPGSPTTAASTKLSGTL